MDVRRNQPERPIRFIHRYRMSDIPKITKNFDEFDEGVTFDFSFKCVKARLCARTDPPFAGWYEIVAEPAE